MTVRGLRNRNQVESVEEVIIVETPPNSQTSTSQSAPQTSSYVSYPGPPPVILTSPSASAISNPQSSDVQHVVPPDRDSSASPILLEESLSCSHSQLPSSSSFVNKLDQLLHTFVGVGDLTTRKVTAIYKFFDSDYELSSECLLDRMSFRWTNQY